ncbi:hypothetical protein [Spirillospora sp. NPDC029432]|uniref:hypothetical protein n=1 Tax=Spirillospora sp. NPDC029432 TaxID=3154599 RepID=UPI0034519D74
MEFAALGAWLVAAAVGAYLMATWITGGGLRRQATKVTRYPLLVLVGHPLAAVAGLLLWAAFLATGQAAYAWGAFTALLVVMLQGFVLFTRWLVGRGGRHARDAGQEFPARAVILHGAVGAATFVLVLLTAVRAGA